MASLAAVVSSIVGVVTRANANLVRDLERESETLDRLWDSFSRILAKDTLSVWSFVEERTFDIQRSALDARCLTEALLQLYVCAEDFPGAQAQRGTQPPNSKVLHSTRTTLPGLTVTETALEVVIPSHLMFGRHRRPSCSVSAFNFPTTILPLKGTTCQRSPGVRDSPVVSIVTLTQSTFL
jgi:hypothetical protein